MGRREPSQSIGRQISTLFQKHMGGFGGYPHSGVWNPPVNVYQLPGRLEICVDLAGVDRSRLDVRVEPGRLVVAGVRTAPEPHEHGEPIRILAMEIDHGPFERTIALPDQIALDRVESSYKTGLLWITLPFRKP